MGNQEKRICARCGKLKFLVREGLCWRCFKKEERRRRKQQIKTEKGRLGVFWDDLKRIFIPILVILGISLIVFLIWLFFVGGTLPIWGKEIEVGMQPAGTFVLSLLDRFMGWAKETYGFGPQKVEEKEKNIEIKYLKSVYPLYAQNQPIEVEAKLKITGLKDEDEGIDSDTKVRFFCEMEDYKGKTEVRVDGEKKDVIIVPEGAVKEYYVECRFLDGISLKDDQPVAKKVTLNVEFYDAFTITTLQIRHLVKSLIEYLEGLGRDPLEGVSRDMINPDNTIKDVCVRGCNAPLKLRLGTRSQPLHEQGEYRLNIDLMNEKTLWGGELQEIKKVELTKTSRLKTLSDCDLGGNLVLSKEDKLLKRINENLKVINSGNESLKKRILETFNPNDIFMQCKFKVDAGEDYNPPDFEEFKIKVVYDYLVKSNPISVNIIKREKA